MTNGKHILIDIGHARMTGASAHGRHEHEEMEAFAPVLAEELQALGFRTTIIDYPHLSNEADLVGVSGSASWQEGGSADGTVAATRVEDEFSDAFMEVTIERQELRVM